MASTALNSRILEAMVTSRPETVTSTSPMNGQDVPATYIAQYTATLEDFARRNGAMIDGGSPPSGGEEVTTEDEEGSYDEANGGQKRSASSPLDSAKKRRKQSKPNKIGGSDCSGEGEEMDKEDGLERASNSSLERMVDENMRQNLSRLASSPVRCPYCDISMTSHNALRRHITDQHIGRVLSEEEIMIRQSQIAKQKLFEQQHQDQQQQIHYQQKFMNDALRFQEQAAREREALIEHGQRKNSERNNQEQRESNQDGSPSDQIINKEREEGETGPLNLSNSRWENHSSHSQEPQRSPITPLPASIPMPQSFPDGRFNLPGLSPFAPPHFLLPFMQPNGREPGLANSPQNNFGSGGSRIFNLEAFCELCNKEFCNKYFLKTHKANKHGIFTDEPSCSPMPPTPPTPLGPSTPIGSNTPLLNPLLHSPITPTSMGGSPYAGAFLAANLGNLPLRPPLPVSLHSNSKPLGGPSKSDSSPISKSGIINLDAYCELCQKEFCNKYFLKRHKLKIHNVNIEVTIKSPKNSSALDRPEGWCDACRRDIGSRSSLNVHKLNVHGPHIINNISTSEPSPRPPLDFRQLNSLPMKFHNGDQIPKHNFSPWDHQIREKEVLDHHFGKDLLINKINPEKELRMEQNGSDINKSVNEHIFMNDKMLSPVFSMHNAMSSESLFIHQSKSDKEGPMLSPNFVDLQKIKIPPSNASIEDKNNTQVKVEERMPSENSESSVSKSVENSQEESQMPTLKPQMESHCDLSTPKNCPVNEERPPLLTKEQMALHGKMDYEDNHDHTMNNAEPPRTPGGVSNSTDDSSREAGFIARVGQPAIVQAPPGTKFTIEQLQKFGVVNPDAFCELCCKEFCNKYFLRTHRIKKHNIYTPEYSERSKQQYKEANPINLAKIFEKQAMEFRQPNLSQGEMKLECDICRKPFPNPYLLHMHKYCFHGQGQDAMQQEHLPLPQHIIPHEHLRQLALQAHHQKIQDHHELLIRQQKDIENEEQQHTIQMLQEHHKQNDPIDQTTEVRMAEEEQERERYIEKQIEKQVELEKLQNKLSKEDSKQEDIENCDMKEEGEICRLKSPHSSPNLPENGNISNSGETDTSQELRKLQSMIFELNRQGDDSVVCKICQKEIGNKYFLRAHMMTEHGFLLQDEINNGESVQPPRTSVDVNERLTSPFNASNSDSQAYCDICKKDFFSRFILQQHMITAHGTFSQQTGSTSFLDRIRAEVEGRDDRKPQSVSRSFCDICQKELCNKYFMKTHMMRMHKINIENDNSGGVTCDICHKDLCSKYFLKVHRQNSHGLVEDMRDPKEFKDGLMKKRDCDDNMEDLSSAEVCPLCQRKFKNAKWLRTHLTQDHGEEGKVKWQEIEPNYPPMDILNKTNPSCSICGQIQPDPVALQLHLIKYHGSKSINDEEPIETGIQTLQCSSCSFVCRSPALLAAHEQSHNPMLPLSLQMGVPNSSLQCHVCPQVLSSIEAFQQHLLGHQLQGLFEPLLSKNNHSDQDNEKEDGLVSEHRIHLPLDHNGDKIVSSPVKKSRKHWKCRKCNKRYRTRDECLMHVFSRHTKQQRINSFACQSWRQKTYKCRKCGVSHRKLGELLNHMRTHYPKLKRSSPTIPVVTHAQPVKSENQQEFVMQRFLMNKQQSDTSQADPTSEEEGDFIPSVVNLPVNRKVLRTLTVSFTLTPAQ